MLSILEGKELLDQFPKSKKALGIWLLEQAKLTNTIVKDHELEGSLVTLLAFQPRQLYDFFDGFQVFIGISPHEGRFIYFNSQEHTSFTAEDRVTAEENALRDAFATLEKLL